ncbi:MAG: phosphate ABC transporter permease PstA [Coriobacteriia bacterium]|nr:phosphate ABC transporter permease PstA [Coriobacteriia bacterium]MBN2822556.1 phosphate ABC transporter permease PstA [Coriobacteriia bacterium]
MNRVKRARLTEQIAKTVLGLMAVTVLVIAAAVLIYIVSKGYRAINWEFLTTRPVKLGREGGIGPAIGGTVWLVSLTALFTLPVGILAGVYLSEYAARNLLTRSIRLAITNMAGVPSIVYGLFGLAAFVMLANFKVSVLSGALTLTCMTLPVVITATEEALRQVPQDLRHASLALGSTKWRTVRKVVLPASMPGIVTGSILGLARAAGETAPILFTAAVFMSPQLPRSPLDRVMALPYHIYAEVTSVPNWSEDLIWGTALVLVAGISIVSVAAGVWRSIQRRKIRW